MAMNEVYNKNELTSFKYLLLEAGILCKKIEEIKLKLSKLVAHNLKDLNHYFYIQR